MCTLLEISSTSGRELGSLKAVEKEARKQTQRDRGELRGATGRGRQSDGCQRGREERESETDEERRRGVGSRPR